MPTYTFVSTADAFVLRGAKAVFVDIHPETMNIDERLIENAITEKTKAIVPVHYAGVACKMDEICAIAQKYDLKVVEDAAQELWLLIREKHLVQSVITAALAFMKQRITAWEKVEHF